MKKISSLLFAVTMLNTSALQAQTADEIINKHIEAIGGKEKLSQVKSLYTENSMDVMGNQAPVTERLQRVLPCHQARWHHRSYGVPRSW